MGAFLVIFLQKKLSIGMCTNGGGGQQSQAPT